MSQHKKSKKSYDEEKLRPLLDKKFNEKLKKHSPKSEMLNYKKCIRRNSSATWKKDVNNNDK